MRALLVAVLLLSLLLAGCTASPSVGADSEEEQTVTVTPNDGLSISFQPQLQSFTENQVLQYKVDIENTGAATAEVSEVTPIGGPLTRTDRCSPSLRGKIGSSLVGADPEQDRPGGRVAFNWKCYAPLGDGKGGNRLIDLQAGATDSFDGGFRIKYGYKTEATAEVVFAHPSRFQRSTTVRTDNTAAPVKADIMLNSPRSFPADPSSFEIPVKIRNVGDGEIVGNNVKISVSVDGTNLVGSVKQPASGVTVDVVEGRRQITINSEFLKNHKNTYAGALGAVASGGADEKTVPITVALSYTYEEEVSSSFNVEGQPQNIRVEGLDEAVVPEPIDRRREPTPGFTEKEVGLKVEKNVQKTAERTDYLVRVKKKGTENIKATIVSDSGFSEQCDARATLNVAGKSATIRQNSRLEKIVDTSDASGTVDISLADWECRDEQDNEPFQLGCLPVDTPTVELQSPGVERVVSCFRGKVTYTANVLFQGSPVSAARVGVKGSGRKVQPAEKPPEFTFKGKEIGTKKSFVASRLSGCSDTSLDVVVGRQGGATPVPCSSKAISRISGQKMFAVDLKSGIDAQPDVGKKYSVTVEKGTRTVTNDKGKEVEEKVLRVLIGNNPDLGCGTGSGMPQTKVNARRDWDGKPWLWSGGLEVAADNGAVSLRDVTCPDRSSVECFPFNKDVDPDELSVGESRTFTTTCFEGPLSYDTNLWDGGSGTDNKVSQLNGKVSLDDTVKKTGINRGSIFKLGGAGSTWSVGDTAVFSVSGIKDCEDATLDVVVGSDGNWKELTCN